jgi:WD40 repeat protein
MMHIRQVIVAQVYCNHSRDTFDFWFLILIKCYLKMYNTSTGLKLTILKDHKHYVQGVCWDPLGQYVVTNSSDRYKYTTDYISMWHNKGKLHLIKVQLQANVLQHTLFYGCNFDLLLGAVDFIVHKLIVTATTSTSYQEQQILRYQRVERYGTIF